MTKFASSRWLFVSAILLQVVWAENDETKAEKADSDSNNRESRQAYFDSNARRAHQRFSSPYHPRNRFDSPSSNQLEDSLYSDDVQTRQSAYGFATLNAVANPFATLLNNLPKFYVRNPDKPYYLRMYDGCKDTSNLDGMCVPSVACSAYGGRPSGSCSLGIVCCVNMLATCGGQVALNNTYLQSPINVNSISSCTIDIKLNPNFIEQNQDICQIRLDFLSFTLAQPASTSNCSVDSLTISGVQNKVPTICGDNTGQHMYLRPTTSTSTVSLKFNLGQTSNIITRSWNIKISMLACGSSNLAPPDCLQYHRSASGTISSFNWKDIAVTTGNTRQLANQDYQICFRSELVSNQIANRICYSQCSFLATTAGNIAFSLTSTQASPSASSTSACQTDFLLIRSGVNPDAPAGVKGGEATFTSDRICGGTFNAGTASATAGTVCSSIKDFNLLYRTDALEGLDTENAGFCLNFQQRLQ